MDDKLYGEPILEGNWITDDSAILWKDKHGQWVITMTLKVLFELMKGGNQDGNKTRKD